jgi:crotonobetainyl-CoA:carnitine CoA-transferase CaiB-like acyl-CoA transferase
MMLGDLGADVIKIESGEGDVGRHVSPHSIGRHNAYFASLNRNKRSVCIALSSPEGQAQLGKLAARAHALVTNLRPSAIKKLGLTYQALQKWNERIVCVALTGYGLEGPYADQPAYDYIIQALTGMMNLTGDPEAPPTRVGYSVVDNSAGVTAALGLLAKIVEGKGGQLDLSLYDTMLSQMNYVAGAYLNAGEAPRRQAMGGHPYFVPAQLFRTRDGWLSLFISDDRFWRTFAGGVGHPEWAGDPRFETMEARRKNRELVVREVAALLRTNNTDWWVNRLAPQGIVISAVHTLPEALDGDIAREREMVISMDTPDGPIRAVGSPFKFRGEKTNYRPPPVLGEQTEQLLPPDEAT